MKIEKPGVGRPLLGPAKIYIYDLKHSIYTKCSHNKTGQHRLFGVETIFEGETPEQKSLTKPPSSHFLTVRPTSEDWETVKLQTILVL